MTRDVCADVRDWAGAILDEDEGCYEILEKSGLNCWTIHGTSSFTKIMSRLLRAKEVRMATDLIKSGNEILKARMRCAGGPGGGDTFSAIAAGFSTWLEDDEFVLAAQVRIADSEICDLPGEDQGRQGVWGNL